MRLKEKIVIDRPELDSASHTELLIVPCTPSQKKRFEACGGAKYLRRILNGPAFLDSKRVSREEKV